MFGTVHTASADTTIDRIVNAFPASSRDQVRSMLADSLRAVLCQHLIPRRDGTGRVLAAEVLINNDAVANLIRKGKAYQIPSVVATARELGMQAMDVELRRLVREDVIIAPKRPTCARPARRTSSRASRAAGTAAGPRGRRARPRRLSGAMARIDSFLRLVVEQGASDLHLCAGAPPTVRLNGDLVAAALPRPLRPGGAPPHPGDPDRRPAAHGGDGEGPRPRLRAGGTRRASAATSSSTSTGSAPCSASSPAASPSSRTSTCPPAVRNFTRLANGLVLVTGPTGSGKTTTLAAIIHEINRTYQRHIITIEDPIEFIHEPIKSLVTHREVGTHAETFAGALRAALREAPDVLVVGELRDMESVSLALSAAETGVLVFATLHTNSAAKSIHRLIDLVPESSRDHMRGMISVLLRGVVAQRLCRRRGRGGTGRRGRDPAPRLSPWPT